MLPYQEKPKLWRLFPDCPVDTIATLGARDSKIFIVPSLDLVVTRLGDKTTRLGRAAPSEFDNPFLSKICQAVIPSPASERVTLGEGYLPGKREKGARWPPC